jgi:hypothetical protein
VPADQLPQRGLRMTTILALRAIGALADCLPTLRPRPVPMGRRRLLGAGVGLGTEVGMLTVGSA